MKRVVRNATLPVAFLVMWACGGGETSDAGAAAPSTGLDAPDRTLAMETTPVFRVGGFEAEDWAIFGTVSGLRFDAQGNLYVMDGQASEIKVIAPDGTLLRTVGKPGEGPGELASPMGFEVLADGTVAVFDLGHQGFVLYDPQGEYLRNVSVDFMSVGLPGRTISYHPSGGMVSAQGGMIRMSVGGGAEEGPPSRPVLYFPLDESQGEARVVYEAWDLPAPEEEDQNLEFSGGGAVNLRMPAERAFSPGLYAVALPDGRMAVVDSVGYRVKLVSLDGQVVGTLERPVRPTPVTEAIQTQEKERRLAELEEGEGPRMVVQFRSDGGGSGGGQIAQDQVRRMMEQRLESMVFAQEIPVLEAMAVDWDGRIWLQRSSGVPGEDGPTDVITTDGRYLGTIPADGLRIPRAFGPGGLIARIETDEFDVETIVVERLPGDLASNQDL